MTIRFDLGHDLDLEFSRSNTEFAISQPKMVRLSWNEKQTYRLNSWAQMWPSGLTMAMTLTLNFQGQIQNLLYLSQKWSDCLETKSKHIDWTPGAHFTNNFSITIQMWWKFHFALIQILIKWSLQYLAHGTTAELLTLTLMPWLHQQPWYWLCRIGRSLSYSGRNCNYLCLISVEKWHKM